MAPLTFRPAILFQQPCLYEGVAVLRYTPAPRSVTPPPSGSSRQQPSSSIFNRRPSSTNHCVDGRGKRISYHGPGEKGRVPIACSPSFGCISHHARIALCRSPKKGALPQTAPPDYQFASSAQRPLSSRQLAFFTV